MSVQENNFSSNVHFKQDKKNAFYFLFLSLMLMIFCFFIKLVSVSNFGQVKVNAVTSSLQATFGKSKKSFFQPDFAPNALTSMIQSLAKQSFQQVKFQETNTVFKMTIPCGDVFVNSKEDVLPQALDFLKKLSFYLSKQKKPYPLTFLTYIDLPMNGSYPVYSHLAEKRSQNIVDYLNSFGIPHSQIISGFKQGNDDVVSFSLSLLPPQKARAR